MNRILENRVDQTVDPPVLSGLMIAALALNRTSETHEMKPSDPRVKDGEHSLPDGGCGSGGEDGSPAGGLQSQQGS